MPFAILMANENVARTATSGTRESVKIVTDQRKPFGGECHGAFEELAERVSRSAFAVCALPLSAGAGEVRAKSVPCMPHGWLSHV